MRVKNIKAVASALDHFVIRFNLFLFWEYRTVLNIVSVVSISVDYEKLTAAMSLHRHDDVF